ncbi:MAG: Spy/CpxP family protein refolding chaperone [Limnochordales bacterium]|nr:Spy/CpxP family protein refolding chaperone [Limnochordales bacterium]
MIVRERCHFRFLGHDGNTDSWARRRLGLALTFFCTMLVIVGLATAGVMAAAGAEIRPRDPAPEAERVPLLLPHGIGRIPSFSSLPLFRYMASQAGQFKLTDRQYSALRSIYQELHDELKPLLTELRQARERLAKAWQKSPVNEEEVLAATEEATKLALEIRSKMAAAQKRVEAVLTPEQKQELEKLKQQFQERQRQWKEQLNRQDAPGRGALLPREQARRVMELRERIRTQKDGHLPYLKPGWSAIIRIFPLVPGFPFMR